MTTLEQWVKSVAGLLNRAVEARQALAIQVAQARRHWSVAQISEALQASFPDAKRALGYTLGEANVASLARIGEALTAEQLAVAGNLGLSLTETAKIAELAESGKLNLKRFQQAAEAVAKHGVGSEKALAARGKLVEWAERASANDGDGRKPVKGSIEAASAAVDRATARVNKLQAQLEQAKAKLAEARTAHAKAIAEAKAATDKPTPQVSEPVATVSATAKPSRRRSAGNLAQGARA